MITLDYKQADSFEQNIFDLEYKLRIAKRDLSDEIAQREDAKRDMRGGGTGAFGCYRYDNLTDRIERSKQAVDYIKESLEFCRWKFNYLLLNPDCKAVLTDSTENKDWGNRGGTVEILGKKYRVYVSRGRSVRIAFARRGENVGFKWNCSVSLDGKTILNFECTKGQGFKPVALRAHFLNEYEKHQDAVKKTRMEYFSPACCI